MPIYEFVCNICGRKSSFFTRSVHASLGPVCSACGSMDLQRAFFVFAYHRSAKDAHEAYGPPPKYSDMNYYKDPRNIGRNVEETFQQWNIEMPDNVRDTIDAAREGTLPEGVDL